MSERAMRFDALYRSNPDPWAFRSSAYESAKYSATLAALPRDHYRIGIEIGCSIGELTSRLAPRCDFVLGVDVSAVAIAEAKRHHGERQDIAFVVAEVPAFWPGLRADLIVLSELLYFLDMAEIHQLAEQVADHWIDGGDCLLVNYLGPTDTAVDGDNAADRFIEALAGLRSITTLAAVRADGYRLDVLRAGTARRRAATTRRPLSAFCRCSPHCRMQRHAGCGEIISPPLLPSLPRPSPNTPIVRGALSVFEWQSAGPGLVSAGGE